VQEKINNEAGYVSYLIKELETADYDRQLQAVEQLKYIDTSESVQALKQLLRLEEVDPTLKTIALSALKTLGEQGIVKMYKWGKWIETAIDLVPNFEEELGTLEQSVVDLIVDKTYHQNPTFSSFATQLWMYFCLLLIP